MPPSFGKRRATSSRLVATIFSRMLVFIRHGLLACARLAGFEPGADEWVEVAVHHALDVAGLMAGTQIFHHLVWLEDVAANLVAPGDCAFLAVILFLRSALLVLNLLEETRLQHLDRQFPVLVLAALG